MFIQPGRLASLLQIARVGSWINDVHKIANDTSQAGIHHARTKMSAWPELSGTCHVMLTQDRFWSMQKRCHDWSKRSQTGDFSTVIGTGVLFDLLSLNGQVKSRADPNNAYEVSKKKKNNAYACVARRIYGHGSVISPPWRTYGSFCLRHRPTEMTRSR